ncbi:EAL domain-containing protein [Yersinia nurmii]|uniref:cyclic-guanylate-specific phosphodiesterase n=1 Tax=Yersinia nurmii TaxID=685706 RepID=A0AAW7JU71_9GAMM|nr:cyclic diguanylate phosphodiesterase [Yersinia nurmii]MDN0085971.1 EAL domain-containing protein [Yersinia nurmii]
MPFRRSSLRKLLPRLGLSFVVLLLFILFGAGVIYVQTVNNMHSDAETKLKHARQMIDRILDNAHLAATRVQGSLGQPCLQVVQNLRDQVATIPDVRSVNLTRRGNQIYCTSLYGPYDDHVNLAAYVDGQLYLMSGNKVTPSRPVMIYRQVAGEYSTLVGIDGYYLHNILNPLSGDIQLRLVIGDRWMDAVGNTHAGNPSHINMPLTLASEKYAYSITTSLTHGQYLAYAWQYASGSLIFFPLLGFISAFLVFRLCGKSSSPMQVLNIALENGEFVPYLQPVVTGKGEHCIGCEVLMRWHNPNHGMIQPDRFIPLAEDCGLIVPMTRSIMQQVSSMFAPYASQLPDDFHFGFNISADHCRDLSLVDDCRAFIAAFAEKPINITLELTERKLIVADEITDCLFAELHTLGVFIAIDDFGTGHSSLVYLQKFKVDFLKIDQSFVGMIGSDALSSIIVENVIDLATKMGLMTIAEGVENETQARYLQACNVDYLQGYLFGRPMPMAEFIEKNINQATFEEAASELKPKKGA